MRKDGVAGVREDGAAGSRKDGAAGMPREVGAAGAAVALEEDHLFRRDRGFCLGVEVALADLSLPVDSFPFLGHHLILVDPASVPWCIT